MRAADFLSLFGAHPQHQTLAARLRTPQQKNLWLQGLAGSLDAITAAVHVRDVRASHLFILPDKETAAYFLNDLQSLLEGNNPLLFPMSYKRPYEFDETENANVLLRAEVLNALSEHPDRQVIVTYPEALVERVVNQQSLAANTFVIKRGEALDLPFLEEFLHSFEFEKTDFVYEAGQFAVRGGIIDVFSFAHELPYRIELFGDEVESIRSFDPGSQLSVEEADTVRLMPDVQTRLTKEARQSLLEFMAPSTRIWISQPDHVQQVMNASFARACEQYAHIRQRAIPTVVLQPEELFDSGAVLLALLARFQVLEWGSRSYFPASAPVAFDARVQPAFNKNFDLLAKDLLRWQDQGYHNFIAAEQARQTDRLHRIFEEIEPRLRFQPLPFALREGFIDHQQKIVCYTDHQIFERFHRYRAKERFSKSKALTFRELQQLQPGDFVTHIDYGIAKFAGLEKKSVNGREQEAIRLVFRDDDILYINIHALHKISKYAGKDGSAPAVNKLGSGDWDTKKARVRKKVKEVARELIELYAKRKSAPGHAFASDGFLQAELESSFLYEDTPDQARATEDVKRDMEQPHPMDRLVCGDVGFGKTEVAIRAAFKAATEGKQVAVLVPTTILAMQHYRTFSERLGPFPVRIAYVSRFKSEKEIKETLREVAAGEVNILIGTHRVVSQDVVFKNLGLLIIDEEQKFGVKVKDRLKQLRVNVDVLTLTATPIPRTLHFSLMGARDLSIIATPPSNRQPVTTEVHAFGEEIIRDAVSRELRRGGQVFFVHNRISDIEAVANTIYKLVPDSRIGIAHGQMEGDRLEKVMLKFIEGAYDVLVSTNIIESGLDIPNANTMIINQAHLFGLSDLHQMRGRVGRSNKKAFCYLLTPPSSVLTSDSRKRLAALEEFSDLGDGFKVAMRDLDIRGAGNLLGAEQSGFINDLGFDTYHKILDEAIQELKENDFKELFAEELSSKARLVVPDCAIETDLEILIPENYVSNTSERLQLYAALDNIENEETLALFRASMIDRFGKMPGAVAQLIDTVRLRWLGEHLGFEKISLKGGKLRGQFVSGKEDYFKSDAFGKVLDFVQRNARTCRLKETGNRLLLLMEGVESVGDALARLDFEQRFRPVAETAAPTA